MNVDVDRFDLDACSIGVISCCGGDEGVPSSAFVHSAVPEDRST